MKKPSLLASAAIALLAVGQAVPPAAAQESYFDDAIDQINDLMRRTEQQGRMRQALNAENLVHATTLPSGAEIWVDLSTIQRNGTRVFFDQVSISNPRSFARSQHSGDCASGSMSQHGAQVWSAAGVMETGITSSNVYYPPNTYGRQVLNKACEL